MSVRNTRRALILSLTVGQGHNAASKAIAEYLETQGIECRILDTYSYLSKLIGKSLEKGYNFSVRYTPQIYRMVFNSGVKKNYQEDPNLNVVFPFAFADIAKTKMAKYIKNYNPDIIICPHVFCGIMMMQLKKSDLVDRDLTVIGINTDFQLHPFWEHTNVDRLIVPADFLIQECADRGMDPDKILPFGIPVLERFYEHMDKKDARELLGLGEMYTVLLLSGGMGFGDIPAVLKDLDSMDERFQIIVVCGANRRLLDKLSKETYKNPNIVLVGYTDKMNNYMDAADVVFTKPGGLSISEALAKDKPILLMPPIPGVEQANRTHFMNCSLALGTNEYIKGSTALRMLLNDDYKVRDMAEARKRHTKPHSAKRVGDYIVSMLNKKDENKEALGLEE